jgi:hypothetical protein
MGGGSLQTSNKSRPSPILKRARFLLHDDLISAGADAGGRITLAGAAAIAFLAAIVGACLGIGGDDDSLLRRLTRLEIHHQFLLGHREWNFRAED